MLKKLHIILFLLIAVNYYVSAQFSIGIVFSGIGYHPRSNTNNFKWKLNKSGKLTGFASISITASYRFNDYLGIKLAQIFAFHDCAGQFSGITHLGIDLHDDIVGWKNTKNQFSASIGPFWYYRKNWNKNPKYIYDSDFIKRSKNKKWEHLFIWYGGQIEYNYYYNSSEAISLNFLPAYPHLYTMGIGAKHTYE